jgi:hypothetical protein
MRVDNWFTSKLSQASARVSGLGLFVGERLFVQSVLP